jgi:uncharacterized SAM-binding protein YcdF (DUF218 family)
VIARLLEAPRHPLEPLDAIVVLGAPLRPSGRLSPILEERVAAAAALYHAGGARLVVATGGITEGAPRAEADAIAEGLSAAGIPDVLVERDARTTAENARFTARLLAPLGARTVWIVTQPFHGRRAALLFRRAGLSPCVWHIADSVQYRDRRRAMRWVAREYASWALLAARTLSRRS